MAKVHVIVPTKWCHTSSAQRWSPANSSAQRWSSAYSSGEVGNVLYGGSWGLGHQVGAPKGHLPHGGSDGIHVHHPHGLILYNATGAHHGYSWFDCCFQLQWFQRHLRGDCWQQVPLQASHHFPETWGVVPLPLPSPEAQLVMWILALSPQPVDTLLPFSVEPFFPQNSGCEASILTQGGSEGPVPVAVTGWEGCNTSLQPGNQVGDLPSWLAPHPGFGKYWVPPEAS